MPRLRLPRCHRTLLRSPLVASCHEMWRPSFLHVLRQGAGRVQRRCLSRTSPAPSDSVHGASRTSRVSGSSSFRAPRLDMPPEPPLPARLEGGGVVFVDSRPLDLRENKDFDTVVPLAHVIARLRIGYPVAGMTPYDSRKAGYRLAGLRLGRAGFAPAGRLIAFQKGLTSFHPREPALTGRTRIPVSPPIDKSMVFWTLLCGISTCVRPGDRAQLSPRR